MTIAPIKQPAVLLQLVTTAQTTLVTGTTHQPISPLCLTLLSEDLRLAEVLAMARIHDTQMPVAHAMYYRQLSQVQGAVAPNYVTLGKLTAEILP
jgi:hypothetical protein